jgi:hypothetical protein
VIATYSTLVISAAVLRICQSLRQRQRHRNRQRAGQLRRAAEKLEKDNARTARHGLRKAGWNIDDLGIAADRAQDLADSLRHAKRIAYELFAGLRTA